MKTIAQQLKITDFPFTVGDKDGNEVYFEDSNGCIIDNRPKCQVETVTIDGVDYELKEIKK